MFTLTITIFRSMINLQLSREKDLFLRACSKWKNLTHAHSQTQSQVHPAKTSPPATLCFQALFPSVFATMPS